MIPCRFFAQGFCRNEDSCDFVHERNTTSVPSIQPSGTVASTFPAIERLNINSAAAIHPNDTISLGESSHQVPLDSRARVPCKYLSRPGGCQKASCPYLHTANGHEEDKSSSQDFEENEDEGLDRDDDFSRDLSGASVYFNEFGHVLKVSLPTDYSLAYISGFVPGTTPEAIIGILNGLGFNLTIDCVRIPRHAASSETKAMLKVEDPLFAKELSARLKNQRSALSATPMPIDAKRMNCRKIYISWHKATRSVWMNFGNGEIANRVAQKFNKGTYKCLGQPIKSSTGRSSSRGGWHNPMAWTITLSDIPSHATSEDIKRAIISPYDEPRHIELGSISYRDSDADISVEVRSHLEEHGPLESFYLTPASTGKRVKCTAWFQDEADARSACSLNNRPLDILGRGKLTVTLVQSAKFKVSIAVYFASKSKIDNESKTWKERRLAFHVYLDTLQRFATLKVEGGNAKDVANARKTLDEILSGVVLMDGGNTVWGSALNNNGSAYKKLKSIEEELHVVIIRDKPKHRLQFYGSPDKFQQVVHQITDMLKEESSMSYEIDLNPHQFLWTIHGGFKSIEQVLGKNVAVFNVVSRRIIINGTRQQHETALAIMDGERAVEARFLAAGPTGPERDCPICFCEADAPIQTLCKHTYCLECFEEYCKIAASTGTDEFQVKCQGNEGICSTVFSLRELKDHLSSLAFEIVLKSSFDEYIKRRPEEFCYCPTPDCGYIYRCTAASGSKRLAYTCPNCFEPLCISCRAPHGEYTCAEYKDIVSGGREALEKLKRELNIKDCPKCTTPMEKTQGCNHMTCGGCKAHICWVCMEVFETSRPCYDHMNKEHGGIGLGLQHFIDW